MSDAPSPRPCRIRFLPDNVVIESAPGVTLLDAALSNGVIISHACTKGACQLDRVEIIEGMDHLSAPVGAEKDFRSRLKAPKGARLACQALVSGDCVVEIDFKPWEGLGEGR